MIQKISTALISAVVILCFFAGCTLDEPDLTNSGGGTVQLSLDDQNSRTLFPLRVQGNVRYKIEASQQGGAKQTISSDWDGKQKDLFLKEGRWTIDVTGYEKDKPDLTICRGSRNTAIPTESGKISISLQWEEDTTGIGILDCELKPLDFDLYDYLTSAVLYVYQLNSRGTLTPVLISDTSNSINLLEDQSPIEISSGFYVLKVELKNINQDTATKTEGVYIFKNRTTAISSEGSHLIFSKDDFDPMVLSFKLFENPKSTINYKAGMFVNDELTGVLLVGSPSGDLIQYARLETDIMPTTISIKDSTSQRIFKSIDTIAYGSDSGSSKYYFVTGHTPVSGSTPSRFEMGFIRLPANLSATTTRWSTLNDIRSTIASGTGVAENIVSNIPNNTTFNGIASGIVNEQDTIVAVGDGGKIVVYPVTDPPNITNMGVSQFNAGPNAPNFNSVVYGNGTFVAVGTGGYIVYSNDGETWTPSLYPTAFIYTGVAYNKNNKMFVAVGRNGVIIYSNNNGKNWKKVNGDTEVTKDGIALSKITLNGVTYGERTGSNNGKFVAVGNAGAVLYSKNGIDWKPASNNVFGDVNINGVTFDDQGENRFVIFGDQGKVAFSNKQE